MTSPLPAASPVGASPDHVLAWPAALALDERRDLPGYRPSLLEAAVERAHRRLGRWRGQAPFDRSDLWRRRLHDLGLLAELGSISMNAVDSAEGRLLELLATPEHLPVSSPAWLDGWRRLYDPAAASGDARSGIAVPGFLRALRPLVQDALERLDGVFDGLDVPSGRVDWGQLRQDWMRLLAQRLNQRLLPTMVLELRIAGLEERLDGDTPEDRYRHFLELLDDPVESFGLLSRYPVLLRLLWEDIGRWLGRAEELLRHTVEDWVALTEFLGGDPGPWQRLAGSGGDPHRGGRQVLFVTFADAQRLVYKPRSMALEARFQELMGWAGERSLEVPRPLRILDRGSHGWMEWLEPAPCVSAEQVARFYRRQGVLLAFLQVLGATDLHHENLMAVADQPLVLDLETLCHPPLADPEGDAGTSLGPFEDSVLRVGLLPLRLRSPVEDAAGLDASGLGAEAGQRTPGGAWQIDGVGTDEMRLMSGDGTLTATPGRPVLDGETVDAVAYGAEVAEGFAAVRRWMVTWRHGLVAVDGPLSRWHGAASRVVVRPTQLYGRLLQESLHPQLLAEAVDRDRHFDRLWLQVPSRPWLRAVVASEGRDLRQGDIPYFETRTDSRRLWDAQGRDLGPLLAESGMEGVERRLADLEASSTSRQLSLVRQTFELRAAEKGLRPRPRSHVGDRSMPVVGAHGTNDGEASPEAYLEAAQRIADDLRSQAFIDRRGARWWAPRRLGAGRWTLSEAGPDLYYGVSGLALFYRQLAEIGGRSVDVEMAEATEATLRYQLSLNGERLADLGLRSIGAYSGWGGVLYSLTFLARHGGRDDRLRLAEHHLADLQSLISVDERFDIVEGAAGAMVALLRLAALRPGSGAVALAEVCGERLLDHGQSQTVGLGWPPPEGARGPLTGLSHGAAGIAWALFELAGATAGSLRQRCLEAGRAALDYEDSLYDDVRGNWPDLRAKPEGYEDHRLLAWCHGAPGIGLARLATLEALASNGLLDETLERRLRRDVQRAASSTWQQGFGLTHSLCHGDLGNLEFLFEAAAQGILPAAVESTVALRLLGGRILSSVRSQGCLLGTPGGTNPPGLLVGRAGVGWGLLRLAAPTQVVSILRLALPGSVGGSKTPRPGSTESQAITLAG